MPLPTNIRNLQFSAGDPGAILSFGRSQSQDIAQSTPSQKFGEQLMELLKQQQQLGTRRFQEQEIGAQETQARRLFETPQELIGAPPSTQAAVREASAQAVQPTIQQARQATQTFTEQIRGLGNALSQAQAIGEWMFNIEETKKQTERQEKLDAWQMFTQIPEAFQNMDDEQKREFEKRMGVEKGFIDLLPEPTAQRRQELELEQEFAGKQLELRRQSELEMEKQLATAKLGRYEPPARRAGDTEITSDIDVYARDYAAGNIAASSIPKNIRTQALALAQSPEFKQTIAAEGVEQDIVAGINSGDYESLGRTAFIEKIAKGYPEFSSDQVAQAVDFVTHERIPETIIPPAETGKSIGFFEVAKQIPEAFKDVTEGFFSNLFSR